MNKKPGEKKNPATERNPVRNRDLKVLKHPHHQSCEYLLIRPVNGLCNRLRTLLSFGVLGEILGKRVYVYWEKGFEFSNEKFSDLFQNGVRCVSSQKYRVLRDKSFKLDRHLVLPGKGQDRRKFRLSQLLGTNCPKALSVKETRNMWDYLHPEEYSKFETFWPKLTQKYRNLLPVPRLLSAVQRICSSFTEDTVGVHIRRGDAMLHECKENYMVSSDQAFMYRMNLLLSSNPKTNFFLATDCEKTAEKFKSVYGDKVLVNPEKKFHESLPKSFKGGQNDAVVDLFALSKTKALLGTNWSSFSYTASLLSPKGMEFSVASVFPTQGQVPGASGTIKKGISIVTVCMNRNANLEKAVKSWLKCKRVDEIVVVDWSSKVPVRETLAKIHDPRIRLVTCVGQKSWVLTSSFNLGIRMSGCSDVLKLDADITLDEKFFDEHTLERGSFFAGDWKRARNPNEQHLNGQLFARREHLFRVNLYDQRIQSYGGDDTDIVARLEELGLGRKPLNNDTISHLPHSDRERLGEVKKDCKFPGIAGSKEVQIQKNLIALSKVPKWGRSNKLDEFSVKEVRGVELVFEQKTFTPTFDERILESAETLAARVVLSKTGKSWECLNKMTKAELDKSLWVLRFPASSGREKEP